MVDTLHPPGPHGGAGLTQTSDFKLVASRRQLLSFRHLTTVTVVTAAEVGAKEGSSRV